MLVSRQGCALGGCFSRVRTPMRGLARALSGTRSYTTSKRSQDTQIPSTREHERSYKCIHDRSRTRMRALAYTCARSHQRTHPLSYARAHAGIHGPAHASMQLSIPAHEDTTHARTRLAQARVHTSSHVLLNRNAIRSYRLRPLAMHSYVRGRRSAPTLRARGYEHMHASSCTHAQTKACACLRTLSPLMRKHDV